MNTRTMKVGKWRVVVIVRRNKTGRHSMLERALERALDWCAAPSVPEVTTASALVWVSMWFSIGSLAIRKLFSDHSRALWDDALFLANQLFNDAEWIARTDVELAEERFNKAADDVEALRTKLRAAEDECTTAAFAVTKARARVQT